jgi:hypothetical protein
VYCCVDTQYSLLYGITTSFLETVNIVVGPSGNTKTIVCEVQILKQCVDYLTIKSVNDVYIKRFTQLNSYGRPYNIVITTGNPEVPALTNNLIGLCSYDHTNVTLIYSN